MTVNLSSTRRWWPFPGRGADEAEPHHRDTDRSARVGWGAPVASAVAARLAVPRSVGARSSSPVTS